MERRNFLIPFSIIVGLLLVCVLLPLGILALSFAAGGGGSGVAGSVLPTRTWQQQAISGSGTDRVLVLTIDGVIGMGAADAFSTQLTQQQRLDQIRAAAADATIKAVVVRVDSPGGGVVASSEIHSELVKLRDTGKPLVISMGSTAASGGYYVATPATRIYANPDTLTGSLGVIIALLNVEEAFNKLGLEQLVFKSGEFKDIGSPTRELSQAERAILQDIVDQAYEGFVDVIAEGRGLPRDQVLAIADGRIYTGLQALELGLVDELGNLDAAIDGAKELAGLPPSALVVRYSRSPGFFELLQGQQQPADPLGLRALTQPQWLRLEYRMVP